MIALLIDAIPTPVWAALAAIFAAGVSWLAGRRSGNVAAKSKIIEKRLDALITAKDVRDENAKLSDGAVRDAVRKWVREPD